MFLSNAITSRHIPYWNYAKWMVRHLNTVIKSLWPYGLSLKFSVRKRFLTSKFGTILIGYVCSAFSRNRPRRRDVRGGWEKRKHFYGKDEENINHISAFQTSAFMKINYRMRFLVLVTISYAKKPNNLYFLDNSW